MNSSSVFPQRPFDQLHSDFPADTRRARTVRFLAGSSGALQSDNVIIRLASDQQRANGKPLRHEVTVKVRPGEEGHKAKLRGFKDESGGRLQDEWDVTQSEVLRSVSLGLPMPVEPEPAFEEMAEQAAIQEVLPQAHEGLLKALMGDEFNVSSLRSTRPVAVEIFANKGIEDVGGRKVRLERWTTTTAQGAPLVLAELSLKTRKGEPDPLSVAVGLVAYARRRGIPVDEAGRFKAQEVLEAD